MTGADLPAQARAERRALLASGLMTASAGAAWWVTPTKLMAQMHPMPDLSTLVPSDMPNWYAKSDGPPILMAADVKAVLDKLYQQTLTRIYQNDKGQEVMLAAAYGGDQSDATRAHRPEVCYPAQGFLVGQNHAAQVDLSGGSVLPVRRLLAKMGSRHEPLTYWMSVGGVVATTSWEQKKAQLAWGLQGWVPDGLLLRVSTLDRSAERAWQIQAEFIRQLYQSVLPMWRSRVFGQGQGS
jgi:EpsI family protein